MSSEHNMTVTIEHFTFDGENSELIMNITYL